jgi:MFS transporter, MHS family, proline/betaine transporter
VAAPSKTRLMAAGAIGNLLEWYDFAVDEWGWRIPFWIGLFVGVAGLVLRRGFGEESVADARERPSRRPPLLATFTHHWRVLAYLAGVSVFGAVGFYLMFVYIVSWLQFADGIAPAQALTINTISMTLLIPAEIAMAALSDRIGRRPVLLAVTGLAVVAAWPLFWLMHGHEQWMILAGQIGFVVLVGGYYGCLPAFMVEAVAKDVRCTAIALGYNVALGLIGGVSPLAATWLVHRTDNDYSPGFMIMAAAAISFLVLLVGSFLPSVAGEVSAKRTEGS